MKEVVKLCYFPEKKYQIAEKSLIHLIIMALELVWKCPTPPNQDVSGSIPTATLAGLVDIIVSFKNK